MKTTIDAAGRIVIPKRIREELGLTAGQAVDVSSSGGRIEIEPSSHEKRLGGNSRGGSRIESDEEIPGLSAGEVRQALERLRR